MTDEAFAKAILALTETMYRVCYAQLRQQADREDAVQEALKKAWEKRRTLRDESAIKPWMLRILMNECRNIQRKNRWETVNNQEERIAYPQDADRTMHDLILSLPDKLRLPVVLVFMEGMTGAQAAKALAIPQGTVHSRIHKARQILKTKWEEANRE
ncbi:MAG: RNA polymerase sigma factor [Clostridiales bacterium]|nr:RNA polymerase sigma factor [Clostridiales bacterium]